MAVFLCRYVWDPASQGPICSCPTFSARYEDGRCYEEYTQVLRHIIG